MLGDSKAISGFAVDDVEKAREFYGETLGVNTEIIDEENGLMTLHHADGRDTFVYRKADLVPANYTILNFEVEDIDRAVDELTERGVSFERYDGFEQDEKGIAPRHGSGHRLVQGPGGQHPFGDRADQEVAQKALATRTGSANGLDRPLSIRDTRAARPCRWTGSKSDAGAITR
jgi:catechol 2,3-dioxygenase-like lactoylglutathione lyase family enzyme